MSYSLISWNALRPDCVQLLRMYGSCVGFESGDSLAFQTKKVSKNNWILRERKKNVWRELFACELLGVSRGGTVGLVNC